MDQQLTKPAPPPAPKKPYERPKIVKVRAVDTATLFMAVSPMMRP